MARTTLFLQNFVLPCALFRKTYPVIRTSGGVSVTRMVLVLLAGSSAFTKILRHYCKHRSLARDAEKLAWQQFSLLGFGFHLLSAIRS